MSNDTDTEMKIMDDVEEEQKNRSSSSGASAAGASTAAQPAAASSSSSSAASTRMKSDKPNENLPWVEKYRPTALDELISHTDIINTVNKLIDGNQLPHLLFYGPPGTGKTSTILAVARKINGPKFQSMVLELNASDERGIDVVRDQIKDFASSRKLFSTGLKLVILDEADSMTRPAQFALRRVIEKYTKNTRFCLLCNYINKIIPALQSRCTRFRFGPLETEQVEARLQYVIKQENVNITPDGLRALMKLANGDMRRSLNVMQACHMAYDVINETNVYACTGNPLPKDIKLMLNTLNNQPMKKAYEVISSLQLTSGLSLSDMLTFLHDLVLQISYPPPVLNLLLSEMSHIEHRLSQGCNERLQLSALVGVFKQAVAKTEAYMKEREQKQLKA